LTSNISWEIIETIDELITYEHQWRALSQKSPDGFFTSPDWILKWIKVFWQEDWQLSVILGLVDNKLSIFAPLYTQTKMTLGIKQTVLLPLGQGEIESAEVASEFQDILVSTRSDDLYVLIASKINNLTYDMMTWRAVSSTANLLNILKYIPTSKVAVEGTRYTINKTSSIKYSPSKNNRYKWNKCQKQLLKNNAHFFWADKNQLNKYWLKLKELHTNRWRLKSKRGAFTEPSFNAFHTKLIALEHCKISVLTVEGKMAAINYYIVDNGCLYFYQSGWENNYSSFSPGFALHMWSIENTKLDYYDFMMGNKKQSYKSRYGCNHLDDMYNVKVTNSPIKYLISKLINKITLLINHKQS
jgi:hypothetical protein